jgi:hypothetical protein
VQIALHEAFSGGLSPPGRPLEGQPFSVDLSLAGRGVVEVALGSPFEVHGTFATTWQSGEDGAAGLPAAGAVWGTARLLLPHGVFYDLRLSASEDAPPDQVVILDAARRFVRGDLYVSSTTLEGELRRGDRVIAAARLRFDARDDLGALFRSLRLGRSGILGRRRVG